jgi:cardiolipin synthase (CMP-forming)
MSEPIFTVANQLTLLRMALAPVLVVLVLVRAHTWAVVVFILAGVTDLLDGFIARHGHQQTTLGAMLDPVADKVLLAASYVALTWGPGLACPVPVWLTVIVLSRDAIIILSVAIVNLTLGRRVFHPSLLGKLCTLLQLTSAGLALLGSALGECPPRVAWLFAATLVVTVVSALHYVYLASVRPPEAR